MKTTYNLIAKKELVKIILGKGITVNQAAQMANVANGTMNRILRQKPCSPPVAKKISDMLKMDIWECFELEGTEEGDFDGQGQE